MDLVSPTRLYGEVSVNGEREGARSMLYSEVSAVNIGREGSCNWPWQELLTIDLVSPTPMSMEMEVFAVNGDGGFRRQWQKRWRGFGLLH